MPDKPIKGLRHAAKAFFRRLSPAALPAEGARVSLLKRASIICGGGAKSPLWRKIFANVLGIPLDMVKTEQGPGYGAAMLAMVGCGKFVSVQDAADKLVEVASTTEPDAALTAKYEARYQSFKKLYPALKDFFAATV